MLVPMLVRQKLSFAQLEPGIPVAGGLPTHTRAVCEHCVFDVAHDSQRSPGRPHAVPEVPAWH